MMKIVNLNEENLNIFRTTWGISLKFSEKMRLPIITKVAKTQGFSPSQENTNLEKPQNWGGGGGGGQIELLLLIRSG